MFALISVIFLPTNIAANYLWLTPTVYPTPYGSGRSQGHGYLSGKYFEIKTESIRVFLKLQRWHQLQILKTIWFQFEFQNFFSCDDSKCTVKCVDYRALQLQHWILYDRYIMRKNLLHFHYDSMLAISNTREDTMVHSCLKRNTRISFGWAFKEQRK